jgi:hypothetical protein
VALVASSKPGLTVPTFREWKAAIVEMEPADPTRLALHSIQSALQAKPARALRLPGVTTNPASDRRARNQTNWPHLCY